MLSFEFTAPLCTSHCCAPDGMMKGLCMRRSVKDSERRRGSPRHRSASPRNGKAGRRAGLPSWLSGKPEDANEWFYTDPKVRVLVPA